MVDDDNARLVDVDDDVRPRSGAVVILEGLDATGKSSVAAAVYKALPAPVALLHAGPPTVTTAIREYVFPLGLASSGYVIICDRWHLGERVWPELFERESLLPDRESLLQLEENMKYLRVPILPLFFTRPMKDIAIELQGRGEQGLHLSEAVKAYGKAMAESSFAWQNTTMPKATRLIMEWVERVR